MSRLIFSLFQFGAPMSYRQLRQFLLGIIVIASINAFAETPPPATPFDAMNGRAAIKQRASTGLHMGTLLVRSEKTTLDDVRRAASVGAIAHRGDAGESAYWLCYTNLGATQVERIWVVADGEMGGPEHYITHISAALQPNGGATADCPALPNSLKPLSLDNHLWLGASKTYATTKLGAPSFQKGAWQSYDFQGKVPGSCQGGGFDLLASLLLHFQNGHINSLQVGQLTSC
jgi:hypothetical protein